MKVGDKTTQSLTLFLVSGAPHPTFFFFFFFLILTLKRRRFEPDSKILKWFQNGVVLNQIYKIK